MLWKTPTQIAPQRKLRLERLEERILLDAAMDVVSPVELEQAAATDLLPEAEAPLVQEMQLVDVVRAAEEPAVQASRSEVVVIDPTVANYELLVQDLLKTDGIEVLVLDSNTDGLSQITDFVEQFQDVDAIHLLSHGNEFGIQLGSTWLSNDNLGTHSPEIAEWGNYLSADADILFYGCNLGASESGLSLANSVSLLTGADVATSTDVTGHESLGGNWVLESATGSIETNIALSSSVQDVWRHALATPTVDLDADDLSGSTGTGFQTTWTEGNGPIAVVDNDIVINDASDTNMESATVTLTNPQTGDQLSALDTDLAWPAGITINPASTTSQILLQGTASLDDYEAALQLIQFDSTNDASSSANRQVTVTVNDGDSDSLPATSIISIVPTNDAPIATDDAFLTDALTSVNGELLTADNGNGADSDPDGDTFAVTEVNGVAITSGETITLQNGARLTISDSGSFTYDPNGAFAGIDQGETGTGTFSYTIDDGNGGTDTATATVSVTGFNDAPAISVGTTTVQEGTTDNTLTTGMSIVDVDGEFLFITVDSLPSEGVVKRVNGTVVATNDILTLNQFSSLLYDAPNDYSGSDPGDFEFTVSDGTSSVAGAIDVVVTQPNAADDTIYTPENLVATGNLIVTDSGNGADSDPENDTLTVTAIDGQTLISGDPITLASGAILTVSSDGGFSYDPNGQFDALENAATGSDSFEYTIADSNGGTDTATANVVITAFSTVDLELTKSVSNPSAVIGDIVTWSITVTNNDANATGNATGVVIDDVIPAGQAVIANSHVVPGTGTFDEVTGTWTVNDPIAPGESVTLTYQSIVQPSAATLDFVDLELDIESDVTEALTGTEVEFTVTVTNGAEGGSTAATGVQIGNLTDGQLFFVSNSGSASHGTFNGSTGVWDFGADELAVGDTATLTFRSNMGAATATLAPEVIAVDQQDVDSQANNNSTTEDDDDSVSVSPFLAVKNRTISGIAFLDADGDGVADSLETGITNVLVSAYDTDGNLLGTAITVGGGSYSMAVLDQDIRLEFTNVPTDMNGTTIDPATADPTTVSSIAFIGATGDTTANLALYRPVDSVLLGTTCVVYPGINGTEGGDDAAVIILNPDGSIKEVRATIDQVGTTNGLAHNTLTDDLFVAAFQKRHTDLGPDGNSAIYRIDEADNVTTFIKLDDFFGPNSTGVYSHDNTDFFHDAPAIGAVGKVSLGDIDISDDNEFLFTVNLETRQIYKIQVGSDSDTSNPIDYVSGDSRIIEVFDIVGDDAVTPGNGGIPTDQLGLNADLNIRPFALEFRDGLLYVGMVNSAQYDVAGQEGNTTSADLHAYVYALDLATGQFSDQPIVEFALDYEREQKHSVAGSANWDPWLDELANFELAPDVNRVVATTQPWLTDISFDSSGAMILGLRDRTADQFGQKGPGPNDDQPNIVVFSGGDLVRAESDGNGGFELEKSVAQGNNASGEFYHQEEFIDHLETAQGGITTAEGLSVTFTTAMDPDGVNSGGVIGLDNATGEQTSAESLYESLFQLDRTFGKLNGLGDLEYLNNLTLEIGNRIWNDADQDGIQDAGESGIADVSLQLFDVSDAASPVLVGTTTSDANGQYLFNDSNVSYSDGADAIGLRALTDYEVRVVSSEFEVNGTLENFNATLANQETILVSGTTVNLTGTAEHDADGDGTEDTARNRRIDVLADNNLNSDGKRVIVTSTTGGTAEVDHNGTIIFEYDDQATSGSLTYQIVEDRLDSDVLGTDTNGDGWDDVAIVAVTTGYSGLTDHSIDLGFVDSPIDLELNVSVDKRDAIVGERVTLSFQLTNNDATASGIATEVVVGNISIDPGLTLVANSETYSAPGIFSAASNSWIIGEAVDPGEVVTFTVDAIVNSNVTGQALVTSAEVTQANGRDVDSEINNDDGDHSQDDEDNAFVFVGGQTGTNITNRAQVIAQNEPDADSTPNNLGEQPLEDDEAASTITVVPNIAPTVEGSAIIVQEGSQDNPLNIPAPVDSAGDTLTATITGLPDIGTVTLADGTPITLNQTLTVAQLTALQYDVPPEYDNTDPGDLTFSVSDGTASAAAAVDIEITRPTALDNAYTTFQNVPVIADIVLDNTGAGVDSDPENDVLNVTEIDGAAINPGDTVTLPSGALLTVQSDGTINYDPNGQYAHLGLGQTDTDSFDYKIIDGNGGSDTATVTITITGTSNPPDYSITKENGITNVSPGDAVTWNLVVSNDGDSTGTNVVVTDTFPAAYLENVFASNGGVVDIDAGTITWNLASLPGNSSLALTVVADVIGAVPIGVTELSNTVSVTDGNVDPTPLNNSATDTDILNAAPDYQLTKTDGLTNAVPGQTITYSITVRNAGNQDGSGVVVSDDFPSQLLTNVTVNNNGVVDAGSGTITWNLGDMAAGEAVVLTVTGNVVDLLPALQDELLNSASVTDDGANGVDPTPANNSDSDVTILTASPDYVVTKTDDLLTVTTGDTLTYRIQLENAGLQDGTGVVMTDSFPVGVLDIIDPDGGTIDVQAGTITWNIGDFAAGESRDFFVVARVKDQVSAGFDTFTNVVTVSDDQLNGADPTPENNTDDDTDTLLAAPDYQLTKDDGITVASSGDTITYSINVSNVGEQGGTGVVIRDTFPVNELENVVASDGGVVDPFNGSVTWNLAELAAGDQVTVTVTANLVSPVAAGVESFTNLASVTDDGTNGADPTPANNSDIDTDLIDETIRPDYQIRKSDNITAATPGDLLTYTITATNTGDQNGSGVFIVDSFVPGLFVDILAFDGGVVDEANGTITWFIDDLGAGETVEVSARVQVSDNLPAGIDQIENVAVVDDDRASGSDPTPEDNTDSDVDLLNASPDYRITKDDGITVTEGGDLITYTIVAENIGNQAGTGIVISDVYPTDALEIVDADGGIVDSATGTIIWNFADFASGDSITLNLTARVLTTAPASLNEFTNTVSITDDLANGPDPTPENNVDDDVDQLIGHTDLVVTKQHDVDGSVGIGDAITYTIEYTNVGTRTASGVTLTELPPAETFVSSESLAAGWTSNTDGSYSFNVGNLAVGEIGTVEFVVGVRGNFNGSSDQILNTVTVADDGVFGVDPTPENNSDTEITRVETYAYDSFDTYRETPIGYPAWRQPAKVGRRSQPLPVDTVFTGIVDPGTTLSGKIYDARGQLLGEQTVVADTGGNWLMQFPTTVIYEHPHAMRLEQTGALHGYEPETGFNLRRYFHPAIHTQLFMTEPLDLASVWRNQPALILESMHSSHLTPLHFDWHPHSYQLRTSSTNTSQM